MGVGTQCQERNFYDPNNKIKILNDNWEKTTTMRISSNE